jgi:GT2 family glycosyltransferase
MAQEASRSVTHCSIVIPVFNRASLTRQCLNSLLSHPPDEVDCEIVVVDDGSTDITPQLLAEYGDRIRVVPHDANRGFASACNDGAASASGAYLLFLNNDTIPKEGWLDRLVRYAGDNPEAAVVGSKLLFPNGTVQHAGAVICQDKFPRHIYSGFPADHPAVNRSRRYQVVTGACMLVRRDAFEEVGGFDTDFVNGYEDSDLCLRLGERGYEVHYCHESVLYHLESASREGREADFALDTRLYVERWAERVRPDDLDYYVADGLLKVTYWESYPVRMSISPLVAVVDDRECERQADRLLDARAKQVFELLKETTRLRLQAQEAQLGNDQSDGRSSSP